MFGALGFERRAVCDFLNDFIPLKPMLQPFRKGGSSDGAVQSTDGDGVGVRVAE